MKTHLNCFQKAAENSSAKPISVATNIYKRLQDIGRAGIKRDK